MAHIGEDHADLNEHPLCYILYGELSGDKVPGQLALKRLFTASESAVRNLARRASLQYVTRRPVRTYSTAAIA
jgi:hypothetical protein